MKIRTGFVSNSSSSSFCAFGVCVEDNRESLEGLGIVFKPEDINAEGEVMDITEILYNAAGDAGLRCHSDYDGGVTYIGLGYPDMGEDETMGQFKVRVKAELRKILPKLEDAAFEHIEESWSQ